MRLSLSGRVLAANLIPFLLASGGAMMVMVLPFAGGKKLTVVALGSLLWGAAALLSGSPRLMTLWSLMLVLPLNLSKYFGPILAKGGGETSLRVEISDPFIILLFLFQLRDIWTDQDRRFHIPKITWIWAAIGLMGVAAMVFGTWQRVAALELIRMTKVIFLFIVITNELKTPKKFLHCAAALTSGLILQAAVGVLQYVRGANLGLEILGETNPRTIEILSVTSVQSGTVWRVCGLLLHPNIFGIFLAAVLPMVIAAFLLRGGPIYKTYFLGAIGLGMAALIATLSRSGWLSFAVGFGVLMAVMVLNRGMRKRSLLAAGAASIALAIICTIFAGQIMQRVFESKPDALLGRVEFNNDAKRMIAARPIFGFGLNSYVDALPPYMEYSAEAHGYWLPPVHHIYYLWWAELGIVGLLLHLMILAALIRTALQNFRVSNEVLYALNAACLAAMVAFIVDGFFSFSLRINPILRLFWVLAAMIMAVRYWRLREERRPGTEAEALEPQHRLVRPVPA